VTLVVGVLCSDGVVLGSDGAATLGALGETTVRQPTRKLTIIDGAVVVGASGAVGLAQRVICEVESLWRTQRLSATPPPVQLSPQQMMANLQAAQVGQPPPFALQSQPVLSPVHAGPIISGAIRPHLLTELRVAVQARDALGPQATIPSAVCMTLVAMPIAGEACLIALDQQGAPEVATSELPFVTIGSGQKIADPFMSFLRRVFWRDHAPTMQEGLFATLWALQHCIDTNAGGVADPKQVVVLERPPGSAEWRARELPETEWQEHLMAVAGAEDTLRTFRTKTFVGGADAETTEESIATPPMPSDVTPSASPEAAAVVPLGDDPPAGPSSPPN